MTRFVLCAIISMSAPGLAAEPSINAREVPRRTTRPLQVTVGPGYMLHRDLSGLGGPMISVSYNIGPHFAVDATTLVGYAEGPLFSDMKGWGGIAQIGLAWYWFEHTFSPYLGARIGATYRHFAAEPVGDWFAPSTEEEARQEADEHSGGGLLGTATFGLDLSLASGLTIGLQIQAGHTTGNASDGWVLMGSSSLGYRF